MASRPGAVGLAAVLLLASISPVWARGSREAEAEPSVEAMSSVEGAATPARSVPASTLGVPLTLEDAVAAAISNSQGVRRAGLAVEVSRAALAERSAAFGPSIDASAAVAYIGNPPDGITIPAGAFGVVPNPPSPIPVLVPAQPVEFIPDPENLGLSLSVELRQTLYAWGKLLGAQEAAVAAVVAERARSSRVVRDTRRTVSTLFTGLVSARHALPLVEEMVRVQEERVADAEEQFEVGTVTRSEVLAQRSALAALRSQLVRSDQAALSAARTLGVMTGLPVDELVPPLVPDGLPDEPMPLSRLDEERLVALALDASPELAELRAVERQAAIAVRIVKASRPFLPDLGLSVRAEVQGQHVPFIESDWIDSWNANVRVSVGTQVALFDSGLSRARRDGAAAQHEQSVSGIVEATDWIPVQVRTALESLLIARAGLDESRARRESVIEQERNARVSYDNGLITRSDVQGALLQLLEAELATVSAQASVWRAQIELESITGPGR